MSLEDALNARARPEGLEWLREARAAVAADPTAIRTKFPMVGRKVGRAPLEADADPDDVHAWTIDDAARTLLLLALGEHAEAELAELYRYGDAAERRGLLRALPYLDIGDRGLGLTDDAIRTNDTRLIAAALGPYATQHLPDAGYDQAVLKCVFVGVPITGLDGIPARVTPDGARMLAAFVHERVAAGRDVPAEVWTVIDKYPHAEEIAAIEHELDSPFEDRREAARRALESQKRGASMRIFDPHAHMTSRTTDDYQAMAASGVKVLVEPAFWLGQPRTSVGSFVDYFNSLLGWERFRAAQFGIRHHCTIGLNPKEANDDVLRREVIEILPRFLAKDGVVAVGEVGFDAMTPAEDEALAAQLALAIEHELPVLVHTPHRDKAAGTRKTIELVEASGVEPGMVVIDHNNELTVHEVLASGCWAGFSIYPGTKMDEYRMVRVVEEHGPERLIVNSACDWGVSDPLKVRKTADAMKAAGIDDDVIDQVVWRNPVEFFAQSGRLILDDLDEPDLTATFEGSGVLRGERA